MKIAAAVLAAASLVASTNLFAQAWPTKPVRFVVPLTAGGLTDILARNIGQEITKVWGQPVVVENRPGANTIVAAEIVAKSAPDGHTLLLTNPAAVSINPYAYKKLPYDPERDFTMVFNVAAAPTLIVINPDVPAKTVQEFIALAKARPGEYTYGSFGIGSASHVDAELISQRWGIRMTHVPYKGVADVLPAVASGQITMGFPGIPPARALIQQNRIRVLALNAPKRSPLLPDVPTLAEAGFPNLVVGGWFGFVAPSATPRPVIDKIAGDMARLFSNAELRENIINGVGLEPLLQNPEQFTEFVREERQRYSVLIKSLNLQLD